MQWFDVDKQGLAKLLERKGKAFALFELIQNAWDTEATKVDIMLDPIEGVPYVEVTVVDDDPTGFSRLDHAFTLFAESDKKSDPGKRGRFNLGEKLVLALCRSASIKSTTGTVTFDPDGRKVNPRSKRETGSAFVGEMRMTRDEMVEVRQALTTLLPPQTCSTYLDGVRLPQRTAIRKFEVALPTEMSDADGFLRRSERITEVTLHETLPGEPAQIYEMGIPVIELPDGDPWHINVQQKIPLNLDRDNVTPSYLRRLRAAVLNASHEDLPADGRWLGDALSDSRVSAQAVASVLDIKFGPKRVINDLSDPEGTKLAASKGYTVIHGGSLSRDEWDNVKRYGAALPAGQVTPSPKPYSPDGDPEKIVPESEWTADISRVVRFSKRLGRLLLDAIVYVRVVREPGVGWSANFGRRSNGDGSLALNLGSLGHKWFAADNREDILTLLIHEFGHYYSGDHLSSEYHRSLCGLGARLAILAAKDPSAVEI